MTDTFETLATCWTTAGDVMPARTGPASPVGVRDRVAAAAAAGFTGFGIGHADITAVRDTIGLPALADLLDEHRIAHLELEYLDDWWLDGDRRAESDRVRADLLDVASALPVRHVKLGAGQAGDPVDPALMTRELALLARQAADVGTRLALEPAAFSALPTIDLGGRLVADVDHPAAGLLVDIWHIVRSGTPFDVLAGLLPAERILAVEIDDGRREPVGTLYEDTFDHRLQCGQGEFGVEDFIRAMAGLGFRGPWGVEIMSIAHRTLPPAEAARQANVAARRCLAAALAPAPG
jgi:sugar phosphate isomerase/epimerase